jgi:hypothetical protein
MAKLLRGLAVVLGVVAFAAMPTVAQAHPKFFINGKKAGSAHEPIIGYGAVVLENTVIGKLVCQNLASGNVWNETTEGTEKGLANTEGYTTYNCTAEPECKGVFATAEKPVEVTEKENSNKEKVHVAQRGPSTLPWTGEAVEEEGGEKLKKIKTHGIKVTIVAPCLSIEIPFEGALEPISVNGAKNGLHASHLTFEGKGGRTGFLTTPIFGAEKEENIGYTSGEVTVIGQGVQLISVE